MTAEDSAAGPYRKEDYLLDLTRPYHNLTGIEKEGSRQSFYYDNGAAVMEENGRFHYYLSDELGSPLRINGYEPSEHRGSDSQGYLTYGYDEFGNDLSEELIQAGIPSPYASQGEAQPFGYTGYRYDDISGTYFAQAREYKPETGRFLAEDLIKGNGLLPQTLNPYVYCWNSPLMFVDLDGKEPEDYEYIYYVNNPEAAGTMGHTAFLLVKENGMAEYYSYSTVSGEYVGKILDVPGCGKEYKGMFYTSTRSVENSDGTIIVEPVEIEINDFVEKGYVLEGRYSGKEWIQKGQDYMDSYTRAIIIPITDAQGDNIHDAAQELLYNESTYNLWTNNCVQVVRDLISEGGIQMMSEEFMISMLFSPSILHNIIGLTNLVIPNIDYFWANITALECGYEEICIDEK